MALVKEIWNSNQTSQHGEDDVQELQLCWMRLVILSGLKCYQG